MTRKGGDKKGKASKALESDDFVPEDARFANILSAPVFKNISKEKHKVEIDDRFKGMLTDDRFKVLPGGSVDAYGRKKKQKAGTEKEIEELYQVPGGNNNDDNEDNEDDAERFGKKSKKGSGKQPAASSKKGKIEDRLDYLTKLARGEVSGSDDSDSDASDSDEDDENSDDMEEEEEDGDVAILNGKSPLDVQEEEDVEYGEATKRISILNCDWDNIKAQDLMMILQSFCPRGRQVHSVTIYPSDFGKERMAEEAKYGPRGIWQNSTGAYEEEEDGDEMDEEDEEEEDDENESLYDQIESHDVDGDEEDGEDEEQDWQDVEDEEEEEEEEEVSSSKKKNAKQSKDDGEFTRKQGAVGIVLADDLAQRRRKKHARGDEEEEEEEDDEVEEEDDDESNQNSRSQKAQSDFDAVALRQYELSKLRYYFAVADCDSIETANALYEALDDVEFEHSAMALEIRFVPDDCDLTDREVHDSTTTVPDHRQYKPPAFIVQAKQHTNVTCTWDEGEKDREKKLTNFSAWRTFKDSDFAQYIASEDEDDDEDDEDNDEDAEDDDDDEDAAGGASVQGTVKSAARDLRKKNKAKNLRKLLLGDAASSDDDDEDNDSIEEEDDFFAKADSEEEEEESAEESTSKSNKKSAKQQSKKQTKKASSSSSFGKSADELGEDDELVMTYVPEAEKSQVLQRKKEREDGLTPYELELKKAAEKKKERKALRQAEIEAKMIADQDREAQQQAEEKRNAKKHKKNGRKNKGKGEDDDEDNDAEDLADSYRGRQQQQTQSLHQQRKQKLNKKTPQTAIEDDMDRKQASGHAHRPVVSDASFTVDTQDDRFSKVFAGNAHFGIDRTAPEFRATPGMKKIIQEQRKRRRETDEDSGVPESSTHSKKQKAEDAADQQHHRHHHQENGGGVEDDVAQLAKKLKQKFQKK